MPPSHQPDVVSQNVRSLSYYAKSETSKPGLRRSTIKHLVHQLADKSDIVCLQETFLNRHEKVAMRRSFLDHSIYYNNFAQGRAGTLILVPSHYLDHYSVKEIRLGKRVRGRVQLLLFTPLPSPGGRGARRAALCGCQRLPQLW